LARIPRLIGSYTATLAWLGINPGTPDARAIAATVRELAEATDLPLPGDVEAVVPVHAANIVEQHSGRCVLTAFARRVAGRRLWAWYLPKPDHLVLLLVTRAPPKSAS
jgi:hypothetical protein